MDNIAAFIGAVLAFVGTATLVGSWVGIAYRAATWFN